jgi:hypothetical protein
MRAPDIEEDAVTTTRRMAPSAQEQATPTTKTAQIRSTGLLMGYFLDFVESGLVAVQFDPQAAGVHVPDEVKQFRRAAIEYGEDVGVPLSKIEVDVELIRARVWIAGKWHQTTIPWSAVFGLTAPGFLMLWWDYMPSGPVRAESPES